jgi:ABC-2 type transport system permease protein
LLVVPFVVIPAALGSLLGLVLTAVLPRRRGLGLALLALAVLGAGLWLGVDLWLSRPGMAWSRIESGRPAQGDVNMILGRLSFTQHPLSPNVWMTQGLLSSAKFGMREASQTGFFFVALAATAAFLTSLGWCLAGSLYGWTFSRALAARANRRVAGAALLERLISPLAVRWPAVTVLVVKEIKSFTRDPIQWSQALIFFGLLALYIANLRSFSYDLDQPLYKNLTSFLNLSATSLTLATLVTRFVFPSLSLEGPRFWVLGLAPVPRRKILLSKFVFSLGASLLVTESLVLLSNTILRAPRILLVGQVITAALISVGLTALAVGMGALFPNLRESNPSKIVSGFGGTLTLILSIGFVVLMVLPQGMLCHYYIVVWSGWRPGGGAESEFARALAVCLGVMALLTAAGSWLLLRLGARALDRLEF